MSIIVGVLLIILISLSELVRSVRGQEQQRPDVSPS